MTRPAKERRHNKGSPCRRVRNNRRARIHRGWGRGCHRLYGLVTAMAPDLITLYVLVSSMASNPMSSKGLVTSTAQNNINIYCFCDIHGPRPYEFKHMKE